MKLSTVVILVAAALTLTGCKYDKTRKHGAGEDPNAMSDISGAEQGNIDDLMGEKRFEDMYAKCDDVNFAPVYFGFDSTVVPGSELGKIDAVVQHLNDRTERVVVIEGNCDERGSNEYNLSLGENRAIIIRNYMVSSGIDASRIQTRSYGEEKPANPGHDESAWAANRRGEFGIYTTK